jgi:hypothetical protein
MTSKQQGHTPRHHSFGQRHFEVLVYMQNKVDQVANQFHGVSVERAAIIAAPKIKR